MLTISLANLCDAALALAVLVLALAVRDTRRRLADAEAEARRERPVVVVGPAGGAPQMVYPESGRAVAADVVDSGEQARLAERRRREGRFSRNPLEDDVPPDIRE